ncbi:T-cell surface glycoprotein CD3 delta chain-like isoform X2 [Poeciliopsis prolifica]|uniref:T-cell surface glycoprotein CD3 delta chain-like isoform X2 n=1 Tax=Poeciliopsis prolifica TaxID=188132 RepID=UPI0024130F74|nr:T-cell surface glycoprotein CD3 delta chain-like isoform X2 [Poeciliopsis prolifica]
MKYQLLLLSLLAAVSFDQATGDNEIKVQETADGIKLTCNGNTEVEEKGKSQREFMLDYRDDKSGEYKCSENSKIYVKFRTCDNCVELDVSSIVGLAVGDVVATVVVGVAVYLLASQARAGQVKSTKKRSDKQNLIHNEVPSAPSDPSYQPLKYKKGRDEYDVLNRK